MGSPTLMLLRDRPMNRIEALPVSGLWSVQQQHELKVVSNLR